MSEPPETISAELFIMINNIGRLTVTTGDLSDLGYVLIDRQSITLDVPQNVDINSLKIESLNKHKKHLMAEYQRNIEEMDDQIQSLLCIESK